MLWQSYYKLLENKAGSQITTNMHYITITQQTLPHYNVDTG